MMFQIGGTDGRLAILMYVVKVYLEFPKGLRLRVLEYSVLGFVKTDEAGSRSKLGLCHRDDAHSNWSQLCGLSYSDGKK